MPSKNESKTRNQERRERRQGARSPPREREQPEDRNAVPTLKYGTDNNYAIFKKNLSMAAMEKYGDLARLIDTGEYYTPEEIDPAEFDLNDDPHGLNLSDLKDARKERNRRIARLDRDKSGMYAYLLMHLSNESLDAIKLHDEFEDASADKDPLALWLLMETTHRVGTNSRIPAVLKMSARAAYQTCAQGAFESIVAYKEKFDTALDNYIQHGNPEVDEEDVAMDFYRGLDNGRYTGFKTNLINGINSGAIEQPDTLNSMYTQSANYLVANTRAARVNTDKTVFATTADRGGRGRGGGRELDRGGRGGGRGGDREGGERRQPRAVECWGCGEEGHMLRDCPSLDEGGDEQGEKEGKANVTVGSDSTELTGTAFRASEKTTAWYEVLLDNQANVSILHPRLLTAIRRAAMPTRVTGISPESVVLRLEGMLAGFFRTLVSHDSPANVLCMADVEDLYRVTYNSGENYTVHLTSGDLVFHRRNKMYVADMREWETYPGGDGHATECCASDDDSDNDSSPPDLISDSDSDSDSDTGDEDERDHGRAHVTTRAGNMSRLTAKDVKRVELARELIASAGYPTLKEAVHLVEDGNVTNLGVTAADIRAAFATDTVNGVLPAAAKGKTVRRLPTRITTCDEMKSDVIKQEMHSDVMTVMERKFLISLVVPLQLTLVTPVDSDKASALGAALTSQMAALREKGFVPVRVHVDPQRSLVALVGKFPGTELDVQGAGDHLSKIDRKIRTVKELIRCVLVTLPWDLPRANICDLVSYAVSRINSRRSTAGDSNVAPKVLFTGRKFRHNKEFGLKFGDYCEVADPTVVGVPQKSKAVQHSRTQTCIALFPCNNEVGSWQFLNLSSGLRVRRSTWTKMVTTDVVVARMNQLAQPNEGDAAGQEGEVAPAGAHGQQPDNAPIDQPAEEEAPQREQVADDVLPPDDDVDDDVGDDVGDDVDDDEAPPDLVDDDSDDEDEHEVAPTKTLRKSERVRTGVKMPGRYEVYHISARKGVKEYGTDAYHAIAKELDQLIQVKRALAPVHKRELTPGDAKRVMRSSLFLKAKHDAAGTFQKIKARLVANGAQQDKNLYPDRSSPTAALESIMCVLTIAAKENRKTAGIDIGAAYLNALMVGDAVFIVIEKMIATIAAKLNPELKEYLQPDGTLYMRLDKALYGTLIAGRLWYDTLAKALADLGFVPNPVDPCVWNKTVNGSQITVVIFVDDILATCVDPAVITWLIGEIVNEFDEVQGGLSDDFSYLGMHVRREIDKVHVSMEGYENDVVEYSGITGVRSSPATANLFEVGDSAPLNSKDRAEFHTITAKLLYLSHRARPDIALAVSYLTTRVTCSNQDDMGKLHRVLMYINGSLGKGITLSCDGPLRVSSYVDVGFGVHDDGKSHTGEVKRLGEATVAAKSTKQKMVAKDSTEAELVGMTDKVDSVLKTDEFMRGQGHDMDPPVMFQDNTSTITLVTKGGGKYRTVHLRVRQARVKEMVDNGRLIVEHMPTGNMIADVLTKPLQGTLFNFLVDKLLHFCGWSALTGVR